MGQGQGPGDRWRQLLVRYTATGPSSRGAPSKGPAQACVLLKSWGDRFQRHGNAHDTAKVSWEGTSEDKCLREGLSCNPGGSFKENV